MNIAEGSTGQSDPEQAHFLGMALRSLIETVAWQHIIRRRGYLSSTALLDQAYGQSQSLARKLQAFRNALASPGKSTVREEEEDYGEGL